MRFNLGYLSARTAAVDPGRTAIIDHHDGIVRTVSYGALEVRLNRVASFLTGLGLVPGDRIALVIGNRLEFIEAMYGALRAGIVPVMVNTKLGLEGLALSMTGAECAAAIVEPECNSSGIDAVDQARSGTAFCWARSMRDGSPTRLRSPVPRRFLSRRRLVRMLWPISVSHPVHRERRKRSWPRTVVC